MRAPRRRRPQIREICPPPNLASLNELVEWVRYIGSPEHKDTTSFAGQPRPSADASCCPREMADRQPTINDWLRTAIRLGATGAPWEGAFPRYVRDKHGGTVFEGRLVNREAGEYKGYPLDRDEWPTGIEAIYADHVRD